jgi:hypothetical protein
MKMKLTSVLAEESAFQGMQAILARQSHAGGTKHHQVKLNPFMTSSGNGCHFIPQEHCQLKRRGEALGKYQKMKQQSNFYIVIVD